MLQLFIMNAIEEARILLEQMNGLGRRREAGCTATNVNTNARPLFDGARHCHHSSTQSGIHIHA
jgi:hypothetical protein